VKLIAALFLIAACWSQPLWVASDNSDALEMTALFEFPCRDLGIPQPLALAADEGR
jgi:hypothetical protein